MDLRGKM